MKMAAARLKNIRLLVIILATAPLHKSDEQRHISPLFPFNLWHPSSGSLAPNPARKGSRACKEGMLLTEAEADWPWLALLNDPP